MKTAMLPFNVEIMRLDPQRLALIKPVTSLDYYERADGNLHEDGLFSIGIFGRMGDEERDRRFSYIDIKVEVFHPIIYDILVKLKGMYRDIMHSKQYAVWDDTIKDFVRATELTGQTGYGFFIEHWKKIDFSRNKSSIRDKRIELIEKYKDVALTSKILVMPAGLRDIEVDDNGQQKVGEINALYGRLLSIARTIVLANGNPNDPTYNLSRSMLQLRFNEIYDMIERQLKDKKGFVQGRWGSRRIFNGTRNVITAMDTSAEVLGDPTAPKYTDTVIGLFQAMKAYLPLTLHFLKIGPLQDIFAIGGGQAKLIDPNTLEGVTVRLFSSSLDRWNTVEGLEKVINSFGEVSLRNRPVMIDGYYLALIYLDQQGPEKVFKIVHDIRDVPDHINRKKVRPIQLDELLYLSCQDRFNLQAAMVTRYPVTGVGSCYPSTTYVKTTIVGEQRVELNSEWRIDAHCRKFLEFPRSNEFAYLDTMVIPSSRLQGLGADFDGDMSSFTSVYSDEAVSEIHQHLKTKQAYVDPRGGLKASVNVHTVALALRNMTGS